MAKPQEITAKACRCLEGSNKVVHFAENNKTSILPYPKVTQGSRRNAPPLPAALQSHLRRQARSAEAAAGTRAQDNHAPPHQPSGPKQQRPHRRPLATSSP